MAMLTTGLTLGAIGGSTALGVMGAKKEADSAAEAAQSQMKMNMYALQQDRDRYEQARQTMQPYINYGLMGMERMLGTQPMQQTMGGNAQQLVRQQSPTLTERTDRYLGPEYTMKMIGNLLGEKGPVSVKDLLTGKRENLEQKDAAAFLRQKARNLLRGNDPSYQPDRPWAAYKYSPDIQLDIPRRQYGGPMLSAQPYLVGEAGPEIVVPQQNGTVIPNARGNLLAKARDMMRARIPGKMSSPGKSIDPMRNPLSGGLDAGSMYMLDPATKSLMDWDSLSQQPPTAPQPGILEQGPPDPGQMPTRQEFDFAAMQASPWYQQPLQQGIDAIQRSAIGQGGLYSGQTAQALNQFGQDYAFSKYDPARQTALMESESDFNRWLQGGQAGLNRWLHGTLYPTQEMIRVGQNSAAGQASNALQNSQYQGNLLQNIGSAQASGILGKGAAYSGLYNNYSDLLGQGAGWMINKYF